MTTALVLGASGFIGGHIAWQALRAGWEVRGLRRDSGATGHLDGAEIAWFDGDLERPETLMAAFSGAQVVFHAAAYYPSRGGHVPSQVARSVRQVRAVLQAALRAGVERLVYTSSMSTIGPAEAGRLADERDHYLPGSLAGSAYYECKYAMESEALRASPDLPVVVLNPTAVFGPGDVHLALARVLVALSSGWGVAWIPAVTNIVDVRDVAQAHVRSAQVGRPGHRYILGGHNLTVEDLMLQAAPLLGVRPPKFEIPLWAIDALVSVCDHLPGLDQAGNHLRTVRHWQGYDTRKAKAELGLDPRPVEVTLVDAVEWLKARGLIRARGGVV
jgi:dihydroflavonol-4-reductase